MLLAAGGAAGSVAVWGIMAAGSVAVWGIMTSTMVSSRYGKQHAKRCRLKKVQQLRGCAWRGAGGRARCGACGEHIAKRWEAAKA